MVATVTHFAIRLYEHPPIASFPSAFHRRKLPPIIPFSRFVACLWHFVVNKRKLRLSKGTFTKG